MTRGKAIFRLTAATAIIAAALSITCVAGAVGQDVPRSGVFGADRAAARREMNYVRRSR